MGACQPATFFNSASLLRARGAGGNSQQRQSTAFPAGHAHLPLDVRGEHWRRRVAAHAASVGASVALAHRLVILLDQGIAAVLSGQGGRAPPARTVWCWPRTILTEAWPQRAAAVPPAAAEPGPPPACHGWPNALGPLGHCPRVSAPPQSLTCAPTSGTQFSPSMKAKNEASSPVRNSSTTTVVPAGRPWHPRGAVGWGEWAGDCEPNLSGCCWGRAAMQHLWRTKAGHPQ